MVALHWTPSPPVCTCFFYWGAPIQAKHSRRTHTSLLEEGVTFCPSVRKCKGMWGLVWPTTTQVSYLSLYSDSQQRHVSNCRRSTHLQALCLFWSKGEGPFFLTYKQDYQIVLRCFRPKLLAEKKFLNWFSDYNLIRTEILSKVTSHSAYNLLCGDGVLSFILKV